MCVSSGFVTDLNRLSDDVPIDMTQFDDICKEFEQLDPATFGAILREKSASVLSALSAITEDEETGAQVFLDFILMSMAADGKLAEAEFNLIKPGLEAFMGQEVPFEEAKRIFNKLQLNTNENKNVVDFMVDLLGQVSPQMKIDIITVCMLICAVDGRISGKEKAWIRQLIAE